ncbi:MAG TPA: alcohol dehydrogenase catalytic domain-containing protein [Longimicrobiales bacterium]|nr:alcohol dehydrogenase catalytic domain-containing protein [Longimicrobiales bacterium]
MSETMRVARLHAWGDVRIEEAPVPRAGHGEIVIRVTACGLCGSDALDWYVARKAPVVLGHEPVGVVTDVGDSVANVWYGDRVWVHHHGACMSCDECDRRLWSNCATWRATQLEPGGFAEYARVPAPNVASDVLRIPGHMSDETATFIEPAACCLRALEKARPVTGDRVLVVGLGAMGLLITRLARTIGCHRIFGTDFIAERRALADAAGAVAFDAASDWPAQLQRLTGGRGADVVIVTPGTPAAVMAGISGAAPGARVVCFTPMDPATPLVLDQAALYFREIELLQSYSCGPDETRRAFDLLASGALDVSSLVTHRVGLDGVAAALQRAHDADGLKTIIFPQASGLQHDADAP